MITKYGEQIKKYGIVTVDNRLSHDFRVCSIVDSDFNCYISAMKSKLCSRGFIKRCEELMLALTHVKNIHFKNLAH